MLTALLALHWLGVTVYGGSLVAFAVLLSARRHLAPLASEHVVRVFRAWGAGFGLSMGALIFSGLALHWLTVGSFTWPLDTPAQRLSAAADAVFLLLWFSSFHLEIWTLDPARKLDRDGQIVDRAAYEGCVGRVTAQAWVNVGLFVVVGVLSVAAG